MLSTLEMICQQQQPFAATMKLVKKDAYVKKFQDLLSRTGLADLNFDLKLLDMIQDELEVQPVVEHSTENATQKRNKRRRIDTAHVESPAVGASRKATCFQAKNFTQASIDPNYTCEYITLPGLYTAVNRFAIPSVLEAPQPKPTRLSQCVSYDWLPWSTVTNSTTGHGNLDMHKTHVATYGPLNDRTKQILQMNPPVAQTSLNVYADLTRFGIE